MKVLISSSSGVGHVLPMIPLAHALVRAGHDVLWATGPDACRVVGAAGIAVAPAGLAKADDGQPALAAAAREAGVPPEGMGLHVFSRLFGGVCAPAMLGGLLAVAQDWRPDVMVHEQAELAAPLAAAIVGIPHVTHAFGGAVPAPAVEAAGVVLADLWAAHGQRLPPYAGCYQYLYVDICPSAVQTVPLHHIPRVQPMRPVAYAGDPVDALPSVLAADDSRPLVYVTLGTVFHDQALMRTVLAAMGGLDVRVLATTGSAGAVTALGGQAADVTVAAFVPQTHVLPHAALVVSHGGSGTVLATLARALPQLCLPQAADQFRNTAGVVRSGAGLGLSPHEVDVGTIATAAGRLLAEPHWRSAAAEVAAQIAALPSPAAVVPVLEQVAGDGTTAPYA